MSREKLLLQIYYTLHAALGSSGWWPGSTPLEICLGAILTQNTNWENVQKALNNLQKRSLLDAYKILQLAPEELAELIRPAGYFRVKAGRVLNFLQFLRDEVDLDLQALAHKDLHELRPKLLAVQGIGQETADSILLYALQKPVFVVDAYTQRICNRHSLLPEEVSYQELQAYFMDVLPRDVHLFNEFHALLVRTGKNWCNKRQALCQDCPLQVFLEYPAA